VARSASRSSFLFEHDLFGKPVPTFPNHALAERRLLGKGPVPRQIFHLAGICRIATVIVPELLLPP
jgi:hypothetical protein